MNPESSLHTILHDLWLRVHLRRFDGNEYPDGRPEYVSPTRAVDCFYAGVQKSQHIIEQVAREHGIDRVYDTPRPPRPAPVGEGDRLEEVIKAAMRPHRESVIATAERHRAEHVHGRGCAEPDEEGPGRCDSTATGLLNALPWPGDLEAHIAEQVRAAGWVKPT